MTKPRAMLAVLVTAAAGFLLAARGALPAALFAHLLFGVALSGGGSIVLNQFLERDHDRLMARTRRRALPMGIVSPRQALVWGIALSVLGTFWCFAFVNTVTGVLAALSIVSYSFIYTPLKRVTTLNTVVGAVPGAIPPMMGWTAATGELGTEAWVLFLILFVWQFPHFLAIGWLHRGDYGRAGYALLAVRDDDGSRTARQMLLNTAALIAATLLPWRFLIAGSVYATGALIAGFGLAALVAAFAATRSSRAAYWVVKGTIVHIVLVMTLLVVDRS